MRGFIICGGFGSRGVEGKIKAIRYCRENNLVCLGICLGFQLMVIEYCRNVIKLEDPNSEEINPLAKNLVIKIMKNHDFKKMGGTLKLGQQDLVLLPNTKVRSIYSQNLIQERFRHRYVFDCFYKEMIEKGGGLFSGYH